MRKLRQARLWPVWHTVQSTICRVDYRIDSLDSQFPPMDVLQDHRVIYVTGKPLVIFMGNNTRWIYVNALDKTTNSAASRYRHWKMASVSPA